MMNEVFLVVDGNSVAHRAFHAMPALTNKKGAPVGAAHGFMLALLRAVEDFRPHYLAVCFDVKGGTFRDKEFAGYKAQRPATAPDLIKQLAAIQELLPKLGIAVFAREGFEADDLIASVISAAKKESGEIKFYILSGDYDSLQLVDGSVRAFIVNRGVKNAVMYDAEKVKEKFGVSPRQIPALKALAGDNSDNIPGAPGIGPKAAAEILNNCGTLENALALARKNDGNFCSMSGARGEKIRKILLRNQEKLVQFERLATMIESAPIGFSPEKCAFGNFADDAGRQALLDLGLAGIAKRLPEQNAGRNGTLF